MSIREAQKLNEQVIDLIKSKMDEKGISNYALARASGISQSYLSYLFNKKRQPTLTYLLRISKALDISLADIIFEAERNVGKK
jgi:transcriptional regulator with XRE-family HTH domain